MEASNHFVVIFAGGVGSRFWPESRQNLPKQFLDILGTGHSLIQATFNRAKHICPIENIFVVTHKDYKDLVKEHLTELPEQNIVAEPFRKNTAPAAALITYKIKRINPDAQIVICPSDHLILDEINFVNTLKSALHITLENDYILTLGIQPTRPDTGYGYIQYKNTEDENNELKKVVVFTEKPNLELARTFLKSGDFLWNSGIFIWNTNTFTEAFKKHLPEMADLFERSHEYFNTEKEDEIIEKVYTQCTNISIDYGIMEKVQNAYVIPSKFGWSDLGTWGSAYEYSQKDSDNNAINGNCILTIDSTDNYIKVPKDKLTIIQGLSNYIIVDTAQVLLITERHNEQDIKEYVNEIKKIYGDKFL